MLIGDGDSQNIINERMTAKFNESTPEYRRTAVSVAQRWSIMQMSYRAIKDFMLGKAKGCTGKGPWFQLPLHEQKEYLGRKVFNAQHNHLMTCRFN